MKKTIKHIILGLALAMSTPALAQNKVSGTVIDENGDPIIGATVTVQVGKVAEPEPEPEPKVEETVEAVEDEAAEAEE